MLEGDVVQNEQILMVVKTYPTPSKRYGELVCTAGIRLRDNQWIRIYPYPFRLLKTQHRFQKYDIIEAPVRREKSDPRPDSYRLHNPASVSKVRDIPTGDRFWTERMKYIRPTAVPSVEAFKQQMLFEAEGDKKHWGPSILPVPVKSGSAQFSYKYVGEEWEPKKADNLNKIEDFLSNNMFATESSEMITYFRQLKKLPYEFRLSFEDLLGERHNLLILDWEIPQLYFKLEQKEGSESALEKVRYKIEVEIFSEKNEVFLVLGSMYHRYKSRNNIAVDGFIYPKKNAQPSLF